MFVVVQDDAGRKGLGEYWCFDTSPDALVAFLRTEVVTPFVGANLEDVFEIADRLAAQATLTARHGILASALSGVDIAVWDLIAQDKNRPLWRALSYAGGGEAQRYTSGGLYGEGKSVTMLADEMAGFACDGSRLSKI